MAVQWYLNNFSFKGVKRSNFIKSLKIFFQWFDHWILLVPTLDLYFADLKVQFSTCYITTWYSKTNLIKQNLALQEISDNLVTRVVTIIQKNRNTTEKVRKIQKQGKKQWKSLKIQKKWQLVQKSSVVKKGELFFSVQKKCAVRYKQNPVENIIFDSASCKVAWFFQLYYCQLCRYCNLEWG